MFWDHDAKWCIHEVGGTKIDFRFSILQHHTGFHHFTEGISSLKQVTSRDQHDVQRYIVGVIAGAVPRDFLIAIWLAMDFRYHCQATELDNEDCDNALAALLEFHQHKSAIMDAAARVGEGSKPIVNWYIPKLKLLRSVIPNIRANGATIQFSADITEHAHITEIKNPAQAGNNQGYEVQICRDLDCTDKIRHFDLAAAIRNPVGLIPSNYSADNHSDQIVSDVSVDGKDEVSAPILLAQLV